VEAQQEQRATTQMTIKCWQSQQQLQFWGDSTKHRRSWPMQPAFITAPHIFLKGHTLHCFAHRARTPACHNLLNFYSPTPSTSTHAPTRARTWDTRNNTRLSDTGTPRGLTATASSCTQNCRGCSRPQHANHALDYQVPHVLQRRHPRARAHHNA
jgi:hypothetical protein